jgi:hypothetical protein
MIPRQESPGMMVNQHDSRSITVVADTGVKFSVPYRFYWNGHYRPAESIVLTSPADAEEETGRRGRKPQGSAAGPFEVRAFFLFGEIRDRISQDASGISIARAWSVKTQGSVRLGIDVDLEPPAGLCSLFPGLHAARGMPAAPLSFLGENATYPAGLFLALGREGVLIFSPSAACGDTPGSIGVSRTEADDEPARVRVELRFPGVEQPTPAPEQEAVIESSGTLERTHLLCLTFASREEIAIRGGEAVSVRVGVRRETTEPILPLIDTAALGRSLQDALVSHLHQSGGVVGMREFPDSPWISASAGAGCALALRKLFPEDSRLGELALQLADFALRGQVPWGVFHESFHLPSGQWRGARGQAEASILAVGQSARVAELLLELSAELAGAGFPHEKYFLAGLRFVDFFLDEKGKLSPAGGLHRASSSVVTPDPRSGLAGLEIFFAVARVFRKTGHDRYKKALDVLVRRFSSLQWDPFQPPASREGRGSDSAGALLAARMYVEMRALGYKPAEPPVTGSAAARARAAESARLFASLLVPWIRVHGEAPAGAPARPGSGFLLDSFARRRLLCAGHETALLLLQLAELNPGEAEKRLLSSLARECLLSARGIPTGTAFVPHVRAETAGAHGRGPAKKPPPDRKSGAVDARRIASEVLAGLRLAENLLQEKPHGL